jgi:phosphoglucosamine mutase
LRIVVIARMARPIASRPAVLWELGADVFAIGVEPNGTNINQEVGSTGAAAMIEKVRETRADFGIALDGDADRVVMCDEKGQIIDGDQVLALIARSWKRSGELKGGGVVGTVMSNIGLERYLARRISN